jgi:hypothetical protein
MRHFLIVAVLLVFSVIASAQCPVTRPPSQPFIPPAPYNANPMPGGFWHGTASLWTWVPNDAGWWRGPVGSTVPYRAKLVYWRAGFDSGKETDPELTVVGRRLDSQVPLVWAEHANAVRFPEESPPGNMAMMTAVDLPTAGCWEVTAHYKGGTLSTIVLLKP